MMDLICPENTLKISGARARRTRTDGDDRAQRGANAVLQAPPGAGKTTVMPLAAALGTTRGEEGRARKVLVLEPRRLAAKAAATRMSETLGERVGETVGYQVRFERRVSAATRVEVVTEGVLTRRMRNDPELIETSLFFFLITHASIRRSRRRHCVILFFVGGRGDGAPETPRHLRVALRRGVTRRWRRRRRRTSRFRHRRGSRQRYQSTSRTWP
jgi:hypothetical protein